MPLRIILAISMLFPALPAEAAWECPFETLAECRAWLEDCCGAADTPEIMCVVVSCEGAESSVSTCPDPGKSVVCCAGDTLDENDATSGCAESCDEEDYDPGDKEAARAKPLSNCSWCCCCPIRPVRVPEQHEAPLSQRTSIEKIKPESSATSCSIHNDVLFSTTGMRTPVRTPPPTDFRLAVLCIWLK